MKTKQQRENKIVTQAQIASYLCHCKESLWCITEPIHDLLKQKGQSDVNVYAT